ncbi:hypothetical protein [Streptomyces sp. NRRL S-118]|uniref:hypothetical protein n=1 Tax=Streptomyces sp. NRRL S-118 TaxID=1463881 RepID=UPI0004CC057A|nr:hypothetical protein [Streptomyces sp. NRRL S-118]
MGEAAQQFQVERLHLEEGEFGQPGQRGGPGQLAQLGGAGEREGRQAGPPLHPVQGHIAGLLEENELGQPRADRQFAHALDEQGVIEQEHP